MSRPPLPQVLKHWNPVLLVAACCSAFRVHPTAVLASVPNTYDTIVTFDPRDFRAIPAGDYQTIQMRGADADRMRETGPRAESTGTA